MASQVNYKGAAQVAVIAIAADLCLNRGRFITHFVKGVGNGAIELFSRVQIAFSNRNTTAAPTKPVDPVKKNPKNREYRLGYPGAPYIDDPRIQHEALKEALGHVKKDYPEEYEKNLSQK